jgi:hypothetical protein
MKAVVTRRVEISATTSTPGADDLAFRGTRNRTRSPHGAGGHHHAERDAVERGCQASRSPMRHHVRQPQRRDDEGWERHRSVSPVGYGGGCRRSSSSAGHDGGHSPFKPRLTQAEHVTSAVDPLQQPAVTGRKDITRERFLPDPVLSSFPHLCSLDSQGDVFLSWGRVDPMLLESTSRPLLGEAPSSQETVNSLVYVPVSHEWQPPEAEEAGQDQMADTEARKEQSVACFGGAGLDGSGGLVEPNAEGGPIPGGQPNTIQTQEDDSAFLDMLFPTTLHPALPSQAPVQPKAKVRRRNHSVSAEPSCRRCRQAAKRSVVPVAQRATHRFIRQL